MDGSVDITFKNQGGKWKFAYANGQWNNEYIAGTKSFEINMEGKAEFIIKGGITITPIAGFCDLVRVSVVEKIGMSVSKSFDPMVPQTALCSDVKPYWEVYPEAKIGLIPKAGAKVPAFIGDGKCSITTTGNGIQLLEDKEYHFEGFKRVPDVHLADNNQWKAESAGNSAVTQALRTMRCQIILRWRRFIFRNR